MKTTERQNEEIPFKFSFRSFLFTEAGEYCSQILDRQTKAIEIAESLFSLSGNR